MGGCLYAHPKIHLHVVISVMSLFSLVEAYSSFTAFKQERGGQFITMVCEERVHCQLQRALSSFFFFKVFCFARTTLFVANSHKSILLNFFPPIYPYISANDSFDLCKGAVESV